MSQWGKLIDRLTERLGVDPAWPPFEFIGSARVYSGIASGYVRWLNKQLKL